MDFKKFRLSHHLISHHNNVCVCYIAKNACSTLKFKLLSTIYSSKGVVVDKENLNKEIHRVAANYSAQSYEDLIVLKKPVNIVIRDPIKRLVSAYLDKFVRMPKLSRFSLDLLDKGGYDGPYEDVSFFDFCKCLTRVPAELLNEHWMPQILHLFDDINYRLIALENLKSDQVLTNLLGDLTVNVREHTLEYYDSKKCFSNVSRRTLRDHLKKTGLVPKASCFVSKDVEKTLFSFVADDKCLYEKTTIQSSLVASGREIKHLVTPDDSNDLSVILPVYNVEKYLPKCLDSLKEQTDKRFELIIIDDGSKDKSLEVCKAYKMYFGGRLKIISQKNKGLGGARNTGINASSNPFITFIDSDDYISPFYVSSLRRLQSKSGADIVSTELRHCSEDLDVFWTRKKPDTLGQLAHLKDYQKILGAYELAVACGRMIRKSLLYEHNLFFLNRVPHEDLYFTYKALYFAKNVYCDDSYQYFWRQRKGSLGKSISKAHIEMLPRLAYDTTSFLSSNGDDYSSWVAAGRRLFLHISNVCAKVEKSAPELKGYYRQSLESIQGHLTLFSALLMRSAPEDIALVNKGLTIVRKYLKHDLPKYYDFAFFPLRAYHVRDLMPVLTKLRDKGFSCVIVETDKFRNGNLEVSQFCRDEGVDYTPFVELQEDTVVISNSVMWNDWDPLMRILSQDFTQCGINTISWVEGIQDYDEVDRSNRRFPYRRSKYVIAPGNYDKKYFDRSPQSVFSGEVVRVRSLWEEAGIKSGSNMKALINCNFSYGVLIEHRDKWLTLAVNACLEAGYEPVISKHPFDLSEIYPEFVTTLNFTEALKLCDVSIQRFASGILESLAMKTPVIYFNPHQEKVDKFKTPGEAYIYTESVEVLLETLKEKSFFFDLRRAKNFLSDHAGDLSNDKKPGDRIIEILIEIEKTKKSLIAISRLSTFNLGECSLGEMRKAAGKIGPFYSDGEPGISTSNTLEGAMLVSPLAEANTLYRIGSKDKSSEIIELLSQKYGGIYDLFWQQRKVMMKIKQADS